MSVTETILIITLIIGIIILLVITTFIRKGIEEMTFNKFKDIEQDSSFTDKLSLIKNELESVNQKVFQEKIAERKEYYINDAIRRSGSVSKGKVIEHFAPFLVNDVLNPNEIVFMGSPIDLISFTNIDNDKELSIDFLEIKSGNATRNGG
jgi:predicted Holliday junction resolvase-like endonuclease